MEKPVVSIIIPTYNEEKHLEFCLQSINRQNFSRKCIEIIIVDDGSTDKTLQIAKKYRARILHSGYNHIERSKSIGIAVAKGKYLLFIDADIRLTDKNIISLSVKLLESKLNITGVQCVYWKYSKKHTSVNRYCELYGVNDPFPFYLKKRGIQSFLDNGWIYPKTLIKDYPQYYLVRFTSNTLPTLGSQGYMCSSAIIKKYTNWKPYFFHLDTTKELVDSGYNTFAMLKLEVEHDYA
ncbi:glycosyltransferase, partial [Patescibacteria group bacterium]|nr:glycosyltransferase [Patescibacteria group bacterium]